MSYISDSVEKIIREKIEMEDRIKYLEKSKEQLRRNCEWYIDELGRIGLREQEYKAIIEQAIEYISNNHLYEYVYDDEEIFEIVSDDRATNELLQILKGE